MATDGVEAERTEENQLLLVKTAARRLAREEDADRAAVDPIADLAQFALLELVQNEVRQEDGGVAVGDCLQKVLLVPDPGTRPLAGTRPQIDSRESGGVLFDDWLQEKAEFAGAGAYLQNGVVFLQVLWQLSPKPPKVAHEAVDQAKIPPVGNGVGMILRQRIEDLRFYHTFHGF